VHAWRQVASYDGPPARPASVNALLPDDVAVLGCVAAGPGFSARHDATSRAYCYRILTRATRSAHEHELALHWPQPLERDLLHACARALIGTHDFTAFTPTETEHRRVERNVLGARWVAHGGLLEFWIEADSFMRQMNRALVGTMLEVARGRRTIEDFVALLDGRPRGDGGPTLPPHGLYLAAVSYA
jgi:tRNA pseudouridine38-40 synthase